MQNTKFFLLSCIFGLFGGLLGTFFFSKKNIVESVDYESVLKSESLVTPSFPSPLNAEWNAGILKNAIARIIALEKEIEALKIERSSSTEVLGGDSDNVAVSEDVFPVSTISRFVSSGPFSERRVSPEDWYANLTGDNGTPVTISSQPQAISSIDCKYSACRAEVTLDLLDQAIAGDGAELTPLELHFEAMSMLSRATDSNVEIIEGAKSGGNAVYYIKSK